MSLVSFLSASRGRVDLMRESIEGLLSKPGEWDMHIAIDPDEPQAEEYHKLAGKGIFVYVMPRRFGYQELHLYYNYLAKRCKGDWLFNWNDDGFMRTNDWHAKITRFDHRKPLVLSPYHEVNNLFPVISRRFYETIGHFSLNTHVDSWVQQIGEWTGTQVYVPGIEIHHNGDDMSDATYLEGRQAILTTSPQFNSEAMVALRHADADKIKAEIERQKNGKSPTNN